MNQIDSMAITKVNRNEAGIATTIKVVYFNPRGEEVSSQTLPAFLFDGISLGPERRYVELKFAEREKK